MRECFEEDLREAGRLATAALAASPTEAIGYICRAQRRLEHAMEGAEILADMAEAAEAALLAPAPASTAS